MPARSRSRAGRGLLGGPLDGAGVGRAQHDQAEGDAVPGEGGEIVAGDVAQQPAHAQEGRNEGGNEADRPHAEIVGIEQRPLLVEVVQGGGEQGRDGQEEGEFGGRLARQPEQQAADDRRPRARGARDKCEGLRDAELEGVEGRHLVDRLDADAVFAALGPEDDEGADDEGERHRHRLEEMRLDGLLEEEAEQRERHEGDGEVEDETVGQAFAAEAGEHPGDARPVFPDHRQDGAGLDDDLEELAALVVEIEQVAGEDQVAGRGDGQEFGQALDHAEDQGFQKQ